MNFVGFSLHFSKILRGTFSQHCTHHLQPLGFTVMKYLTKKVLCYTK